MIKEGISKGLFDVTVDKSWDAPGFQFYMGDLGNSVPYANYAPANDPFIATCVFNKSRMEKSFKVMRYDEHKIYVSIPENCKINYANKDIISIDMDFSFVVRIVSEGISRLERRIICEWCWSQQASLAFQRLVSTPSIKWRANTLRSIR